MKSVVLLLFLLVQFLLFLPVHSQFVGNWTATEGSMTTSRKEHTGTLLQNGLVLVAGGFNNGGYLSSSELFDLSTGQWTATTNSMNAQRSLHTATLLPNGLVLVAGAYNGVVLNSAELFDPSTGQWTPTGSMSSKRYRHTATLLPNGGVLVTGGFSTAGDTAVSSAEIFNVSTGVWTLTIGSMTTTRVYHTATLLQNGDVLISGGQTEVSSGYLSSAEIFSPSTSLWTSTDSMTTARSVHTQILLENGLVLAAGGIDGSTLSSSELFNLSTGAWTATGDMTAERYWHTVNLLQNGFVLAAGGCCSLSSSEVFNSATGSWSATDSMTVPRSDHTTIIYQNGLVLAAGGVDGSLDYLSSSEIFSNNFAISTPTLTPTPTPTSTPTPTPKSTPKSTSTSTSTSTPTSISTLKSTPTSTPTVTYSQTTPALSTSRTSPSPTSSPSSSSNGSYSLPTSTVSPTTINSTETTLTPVPVVASNAGAIAGGVIGGLLGVVLFVLLLWFLIAKYRREKHRNSSDYINPIIPMSDVKFERASSQVSESRSAGGLSSLSHRQSEDIYISFDAIKLGAILGQGHFGEVYQADYTGAQVAVKKTKGLDEKAMLEEATMIKSIPPHPNVLHYYGVSQDNGECMMVTELCDKGNLAHYLREHSVSESQLRQFCRQIASAMWHISKYGIIHRDLRAENVLLSGSEMKVKVADFGLARLLQNPSHHEESNSGSSYYRMAQGKLIPIPWTPPEVLNPTDKFKYVAASDVWSFGVVMWEIYNHGAIPFDGADVQIVMAIICDNNRTSPLLPRPTDCPDDIFAIIQSCWAFNPQDRPTFEQLYNQLS